MKNKMVCLLFVLLLVCVAGTFTVKADTTTTVSKTVKVSKTFKAYKTLKMKKSQMKNYTITSGNTKIATVTSNGKVKGVKKGTTTIRFVSKSTGATHAVINVKVKNNYTKKQLRLMSAIIYSEAGVECYAGKQAVGIVIMNRVKSKSFPNSLEGVIYQPSQFGPVRNGSLNRSLSLYDSGKLNKDCIKAAKSTLNGNKTVKYNGKNINMNSYLYFSGYVSGARLQIQGHQFK